MKLAVVGSTKFADDPAGTEWATKVINSVFDSFFNTMDTVISGGARGIDSLAVSIAKDRGFKVMEFLPANSRWEPNSYKDRNLLIAETCDALVRISHHASKTYGSGWTADRAEEMDKLVLRYIYEGE